mmetsp:Transcript_11809/g.20804  ORF Transcript_11809/g.20804 Transcript_11809/m.20804 type:complete len:114 (-) Transcript_11809:158-499(-)
MGVDAISAELLSEDELSKSASLGTKLAQDGSKDVKGTNSGKSLRETSLEYLAQEGFEDGRLPEDHRYADQVPKLVAMMREVFKSAREEKRIAASESNKGEQEKQKRKKRKGGK